MSLTRVISHLWSSNSCSNNFLWICPYLAWFQISDFPSRVRIIFRVFPYPRVISLSTSHNASLWTVWTIHLYFATTIDIYFCQTTPIMNGIIIITNNYIKIVISKYTKIRFWLSNKISSYMSAWKNVDACIFFSILIFFF